ncbi:MAG TPA: BTAD domain-containing putative transcriptional regulator [Candidatus Limnocylindrales bacterium]|nr:BTAD domain-containing putative transcriptional regulator [Candidatus Limnocylindrales bacterium]
MAIRNGTVVDIGGARAQTLLALLALRVGSPVSPESIIEELWAGEPPDAAPVTLRSYVSRLRAALGDDVPISRATAGYALAVPPDCIDVVRFERGVREGDALAERGRYRRAGDALRAALGLWHGAAFSGLADDGALRSEATRLEELRLHAIELRIAADLASGRAPELVDELEGLLAEHPFREQLWHHLMLALYRSGRQADALAAYHRARAALDEQLGIEPGLELRDLEAAILRQDVPFADARLATMGSLPVALTRFVGRQRELEDVEALINRARLVTLIGVGGVGKTRLAIEAATRAVYRSVDQVALVDLATISDPSLVVDHVAAAVGANDVSGSGPLHAIIDAIGDDSVLLVLDNCEHVRDAAAALAQSVLSAGPDLRILATSRVALDVAGEAPYPVPPLGLGGDGDAAAVSEAVELLVDRATLTRHDLVIDDAAYATAARICRDLDGLPLAIELAAARSKALSLDEIAERIRDRFQFLVSWRRLTSARHRTLRETMDWSYELLEPDEQQLLARMSVFPGGASLASVAEVCLNADAGEAERLVERLVDASLVVPMAGSGETRYRLLETVRQYAAEQLPAEDRDALERSHAERVHTIAALTGLSLERSGTGAANLTRSFALARTELPSIRAALAWATGADPMLGVEIAVSLERFWSSNHPAEGIAALTRLLDAHGLDDMSRARALRCRGGTRYVNGKFDDALVDYEAALAIHRRLQQPAYEAHLLMRLAVEAHRIGDLAAAHQLLSEAAAVGGANRFPPDRYVSRTIAGDLAFDEGRIDEALELQRQAAALAAEVGDDWWVADAQLRLADRAVRSGRLALVGPAARDALRWASEIRDRQTTVYCLAMLAWQAAAAGDVRRAGLLWGGLQAEVERGGPVGQWELEQEEIGANVVTDSAAFLEGARAGRALTLDAAVEAALAPG